VMLQAEKAMREALAGLSLGVVAERFGRKAPPEFWGVVKDWLDDNADTRVGKSETLGKRKRRRAP
jgi:hypothetical protein